MNFDLSFLRVLADPGLLFASRPATNPLPMTKAGVPYWEINMFLNFRVSGWREFAARKPMGAIIPVIDRAMKAVAA